MSDIASNKPAAAKSYSVSFGSSEVRLTPRSWIVAALLIAAIAYAVPSVWKRIEPFAPGPDYRIPYSLGNDYWMYNRYCGAACAEDRTLLVGDSVIWGHYVASEETLSHYLNAASGTSKFANMGVEGLHPIALAGLMEYYGKPIRDRDVVLFCDLLWISSSESDLRVEKAAAGHPKLLPQFYPKIPSYNEPLSDRLDTAIARHVSFLGWKDHLRMAYFQDNDIPNWMMDHPYESPLQPVTLKLPSPNELPSPPPVAKPWNQQKGLSKPLDAHWVDLDTSYQWRFFRQVVETLRDRGNRLFVLVGPLNEHKLTPASRAAYAERKRGVAAWLEQQGIPHFVPEVLPSEMYADTSHPLANGYALLAKQLLANESFQKFQSFKGQ